MRDSRTRRPDRLETGFTIGFLILWVISALLSIGLVVALIWGIVKVVGWIVGGGL